jgi:hypothetical protein
VGHLILGWVGLVRSGQYEFFKKIMSGQVGFRFGWVIFCHLYRSNLSWTKLLFCFCFFVSTKTNYNFVFNILSNEVLL